MGLFRISICVTMLVVGIPLPARAQVAQPPSRLDEVLLRGTLRVGMTGDYLPFSGYDEEAKSFKGFDVDMAEALGKALGVRIDYVKTSWPKLASDLEADRFDVAMGGVSITLDRQKKGYFSASIMREGKTPIARCADASKFNTLADIDRPGVKVIVNPGGTNERFARAHIRSADITVFNDNTRIFDEIAQGRADLMMTDASETRYQQKLHHGVLCALHPDTPFDFAEKAYWLQRDVALKAFVDQWLHIMQEDGSFRAVVNRWFE